MLPEHLTLFPFPGFIFRWISLHNGKEASGSQKHTSLSSVIQKQERETLFLEATHQILQKGYCPPWITCPWIRPVPVEKRMGPVTAARPRSYSSHQHHTGWVTGLIPKGEEDSAQTEKTGVHCGKQEWKNACRSLESQFYSDHLTQ